MPHTRSRKRYKHYETYPSGTEQWIFDTIGLHGPSTEEHLMKESYTLEGGKPSKRGFRGALGNLKKAGLIYELDKAYHLTDMGTGHYWEVSGMQDIVDEPSISRRSDMIELRKTRNVPRPSRCPTCRGTLESGGGYVGEEIVYCPEHGILWEDSEQARSRTI